MAQNIDLLGAQYSDVPAVTLPTVGGGTASFTDVTGTTAIAGDVAQGKYFFTANGTLTLGTNQGGGGYVTQDENGYIVLPSTGGGGGGSGVEYETGTWTPSEDVASYVIPFTNTHATAPFYYTISDATGTYDNTTNSCYSISYNYYGQIIGAPQYPSSASLVYGRALCAYRGSSATSMTTTVAAISHALNESGSSAGYPSYWATATGIKAYTNSDTRYWRAGRTYKWIAVWSPTT